MQPLCAPPHISTAHCRIRGCRKSRGGCSLCNASCFDASRQNKAPLRQCFVDHFFPFFSTQTAQRFRVPSQREPSIERDTLHPRHFQVAGWPDDAARWLSVWSGVWSKRLLDISFQSMRPKTRWAARTRPAVEPLCSPCHACNRPGTARRHR